MTRMLPIAAGLLLALAPISAPADDAPTGDLAKLQGKWKTLVGPDKDIPIVVEIKDSTVTVTFTNQEGQEVALKGELTLDEKASPKAVDWVKFTRPNGEPAEPNLGIYELDGDTFKVCNGGPGNPRPTEFKEGEGGPPNLMIFTREK